MPVVQIVHWVARVMARLTQIVRVVKMSWLTALQDTEELAVP